jgi:hypothetical protein
MVDLETRSTRTKSSMKSTSGGEDAGADAASAGLGIDSDRSFITRLSPYQEFVL